MLPVALFAQGHIQFANTSTTLMTTNSGPTPPPGQSANQAGSAAGLNTYLVGLYIAPQGTVDPNAFSLVSVTTNTPPPTGAGRFNGGNPFTINGNNGETIAFQIRAWSFNAGATYEASLGVSTAYRGVSGIGQVTPTLGALAPAALFGTSAGQLSSGFVLSPNAVPEPSSIALGLLGLGAIALFRRRK